MIAERLIAVQDWRKHNVTNYAYGVIKMFVLCKKTGGEFAKNIETTETRYFAENELPDNLANEKNTKKQIKLCFDAFHSGDEWKTMFD